MTPEFALGLREYLLNSVMFETQATKNVILAITDPNFRLDPKARTAMEDAKHIVEVEVQFLHEIANGEFKMDPMFKDIPDEPKALVKWYETELPKGIDRVRKMTPQQLVTPVDFYGAFKFPAVAYLDFVVKHSVHHRGQLAAYLRPMGSKVPGIYGGSADEPWEG